MRDEPELLADAKAAEQFKRGEILRGEGEATRKRLVMQADGALQPKLEALIKMNAAYAEAIARYQGQWVPSVVMGPGGNAASASGAQQLVDMLTLKTARDLGLDLNVAGAVRTRRTMASRSWSPSRLKRIPMPRRPSWKPIW